jgi:hypothetical protein
LLNEFSPVPTVSRAHQWMKKTGVKFSTCSTYPFNLSAPPTILRVLRVLSVLCCLCCLCCPCCLYYYCCCLCCAALSVLSVLRCLCCLCYAALYCPCCPCCLYYCCCLCGYVLIPKVGLLFLLNYSPPLRSSGAGHTWSFEATLPLLLLQGLLRASPSSNPWSLRLDKAPHV